MEIWKPIKDFENSYEISNLGRIKSLARIITYGNLGKIILDERIMKPKSDKDGYLEINLKIKNKSKHFRVHRLVMQSFIPNLNNKLVVNHKDGIKYNNNLDNLEWCTQSENRKHSFRIGTSKGSHKKLLIDNETGIFYESITEAANLKNINRVTLSRYLSGSIKNRTSLVYC